MMKSSRSISRLLLSRFDRVDKRSAESFEKFREPSTFALLELERQH